MAATLSPGRRLKKSHALTLFLGAAFLALFPRHENVFPRRAEITPDHHSSERFNQCVEQANRGLQKRFESLKEAELPVFSDVVIAPKEKDKKQDLRMYVIFSLEFISMPTFAKNPERAQKMSEESEFLCDDQPGELVMGGDPSLVSMVVECPYNTNLKNVELRRKDPKETIATYDVSAHVNCAVNHPYPVPKTPPKYAMTAFMLGDVHRRTIMPWVEYHRLIGFDHFFIFVNEEYEEKMDVHYPEREYITYIPNKRSTCSWCFMQETSETHAIFLSRAFAGSSIEWLAITDPDEYIQVMHRSHCPRYNVLPKDNIPEKEIALFLDPMEKSDIGGVRIKNWDFGVGPKDKDQDSPLDHKGILLDFVWSSPEATHFSREKHIIRPFENYYYTTHLATVGGPRITLDPYCEVRFAHIKIVNTKAYDTFQPETFIKDTSLRDKYRDQVVEKLGGSIEDFGVFRYEYGH